jgi:hypothetical protein
MRLLTLPRRLYARYYARYYARLHARLRTLARTHARTRTTHAGTHACTDACTHACTHAGTHAGMHTNAPTHTGVRACAHSTAKSSIRRTHPRDNLGRDGVVHIRPTGQRTSSADNSSSCQGSFRTFTCAHDRQRRSAAGAANSRTALVALGLDSVSAKRVTAVPSVMMPTWSSRRYLSRHSLLQPPVPKQAFPLTAAGA